MSACRELAWETTAGSLSFEGLYRQHDTFLRRMGTLMCGDRVLADDLVQETWVRAWRALGQLREVKAVRGWLVTILKREYARYLGRPINHSESLDDMLTEPSQRCTAYDQILAGQLMDGLDEPDRELLQGHIVEGLSYEELAKRLNMNRSTVGVRLHRLRARLSAA